MVLKLLVSSFIKLLTKFIINFISNKLIAIMLEDMVSYDTIEKIEIV